MAEVKIRQRDRFARRTAGAQRFRQRYSQPKTFDADTRGVESDRHFTRAGTDVLQEWSGRRGDGDDPARVGRRAYERRELSYSRENTSSAGRPRSGDQLVQDGDLLGQPSDRRARRPGQN